MTNNGLVSPGQFHPARKLGGGAIGCLFVVGAAVLLAIIIFAGQLFDPPLEV